MRTIDLRSDTVTLPTDAMRRAMAAAHVGDDAYGEDATVNRLEAMAAERTGKEAAMLLPSGTMANLAAMLTHCGRRGMGIVCGDRSHVYRSELGGAAALGALAYLAVPNRNDGSLDVSDVRAALGGLTIEPGVVCIENTHNYCGGSAISSAATVDVTAAAVERGVPVHLDGARIFNAALALDTTVAELAAPVDSISFCLSKGLAAPVGSLLCGSAEFIERARRTRRMLGGGMRQAGVFAAAGVVALDEMVGRLADDHANARRLAEGLAELPGLRPLPVATNIVIAELAATDATSFTARLSAAGVRCSPFGAGRVRFVTHHGIDTNDIDDALTRVRSIIDAAA